MLAAILRLIKVSRHSISINSTFLSLVLLITALIALLLRINEGIVPFDHLLYGGCPQLNLICSIENLDGKFVLGVWLNLGHSHMDGAQWLAPLFIQLH